MSKARKPFYHLDELLVRWNMTERDVTTFVVANELTLSAMVPGVRICHGSVEEVEGGRLNHIPEGYRYLVGTIDLRLEEAWRVLRDQSADVAYLKAAEGEYEEISDWNGYRTLAVEYGDLVVTRIEMERFEKAQGMTFAEDAAPRRGAPPKFDWDSFWVEVCRVVHEDGLPRTQTELVGRMAAWFDVHDRSSPDESTIKKKLKPLWHAIRVAEGASHAAAQ
jgi:hypothetical protein